MENKKLFSMDELFDLTYLAMMYGRRSKFNLNQAKEAHKKFLESVLNKDNVQQTNNKT